MSLGINTKSRRASTSSKLEELATPISKPIFITGLGRSGTTIVHTMLSNHQNANWLSLFCAKYPDRPYINRWLMRAIDIPILNYFIKLRFRPLENFDFWNHYFQGFASPCRDLLGSDVSTRTARAYRKVFARLLSPKRPRLLIKVTGFPRISFLRKIFPDAKFIHIIRDGRAVANSRMQTSFWRGWEGLNIWAGSMPDHYRREWERHAYSFVALAGIEWKTHIDQFEKVKKESPAIQIYQLKYESFCAAPVDEMKKLAEFCELAWTEDFERSLEKYHVNDENDKWKADLTNEQQAILDEVLAPYLLKYGYQPHQKPVLILDR